jgi:hypothetical protein
MKNRNVFLYWEGYEFKLIKILRELIYLHSDNGTGYNVVFINRKNLEEYIELPYYFDFLCPAHKADFIRVSIVCEQGGIWLDSDILVMNSLDSLFAILDTQDGFFTKQDNTLMYNGVFGSKKNTELMSVWKNNMIEALNKKENRIRWAEIGNEMLDKFERTTKLFDNYKIFNGLDSLYPVNWDSCVSEFLLKPYENYLNIEREYQPLIVLVNSVYRHFENMQNPERTPLNYFINKSNGNYFKYVQ